MVSSTATTDFHHSSRSHTNNDSGNFSIRRETREMFTSATDNIVTARNLSYSLFRCVECVSCATRFDVHAMLAHVCVCVCHFPFLISPPIAFVGFPSFAVCTTLVLCFLNILLRHFSYLQRLCCLFCATQTYFVCDVSCTLSLYARLCKILDAIFSFVLGAGADDAEGDLKHIIRSEYLFQIERCECQSICTATPLVAAYVNGWRQTREAKCWIDQIVHRVCMCAANREPELVECILFYCIHFTRFLYVCAWSDANANWLRIYVLIRFYEYWICLRNMTLHAIFMHSE